MPKSNFNHEYTDCTECEMWSRCTQGKTPRQVVGYVPPDWTPGGLMIVGEVPQLNDIRAGQPFSGKGGRLLRGIFETLGFEMDDAWQTHAVIGVPEYGLKGKFFDNYPKANYSCLPRLDAEVEKARPRVILALGEIAMRSVLGGEKVTEKQVAFGCTNEKCDPKDRKIGPVFQCAVSECGWTEWPSDGELEAIATSLGVDLADKDGKKEALKAWGKRIIEAYDGKCPQCEARISRLRPKRVKCPSCGGKKRRLQTSTNLECGYKLHRREGVAGAVFHASDVPSRYDQFGVEYIIPTYDLGFITRPTRGDAAKWLAGGQFAARVVAEHVRKANALVHRDAKFEYNLEHTEGLRDEEAAQKLRDFIASAPTKTLACDVETNSYDGPWRVTKITCIGFSHAEGAIDLVLDTRHMTQGVRGPLWEALRDVLGDEELSLVFHNGAYDKVVIRRIWGIVVQADPQDTMIAHYNCYPDEEHGLGFVAHELTDAPAWKEESHAIPKGETHDLSGYSSFDALAEYNAKDNRVTAMVHEKLRAKRIEEGVERVYELDRWMQEIAIDIECWGLPYSQDTFDEMRADFLREIDFRLGKMREIVDKDDFTPKGKELVWALFDKGGPLKLQAIDVGKDGTPLTNKDVLQRYVHVPFVQHLKAWRKATYYLSHYIESDGLKPAADGRIHPQWKVTGARTGRWSSSPNFQNWPKVMRKAVVAPPGRKLIGADYDQLELRGIGMLSGDKNLLERIEAADETRKLEPEYDLHSYVASIAFGTNFTDLHLDDPNHVVSKDPMFSCPCETCKRKKLRDVEKSVIYALNYGAGAKKIHESIYNKGYDGPKITVALVDRIIKAIFKAFPAISPWRDRIFAEAKRDYEVRSPLLGRHRIFPLGDVDVTIAYNYPVQSLGADIMNQAMLDIWEGFADVDPTAKIIAQVHDAVYLECAESKAQAMADFVSKSMEQTHNGVRFTAAAEIADNWYAL